MTLESAFPWISAASALAAGFALPGSRGGRALRAAALAALAFYAYFRWITPTSVPMALTCQALGQALLPLGAERWRRLAIALPVLGWLILANLYRGAGDGPGVFVGDGIKAGLLAAAVIGAGYGLWRARAWAPRSTGLLAEAGALVLTAVTAATLAWDFWPVMTGVLMAMASFGLTLYGSRGEGGPSMAVARGIWALAFLGQAAMAYAFVR
jgi:hypothetical protein